MWRRIKTIVDEKLIRPVRESHAPARELGLATAIGVFWGLNPLIGLQMGLVAMTWFLLKPLGVRFHMGVGVAWVWITNPFTTLPLFYAFYLCGLLFIPQSSEATLDFAGLEAILNKAREAGFVDGLIIWVRFMVLELGRPLLLGSLVIAIPAAPLAYILTVRLLNMFRRGKAAKEGLTLEEWEEIHVHGRRKKLSENSPDEHS